MRWFTETDISVADDAELLALMREAGCAQVLIGFESPTRPGLDGDRAAPATGSATRFDAIQGGDPSASSRTASP